MNFDVILNKMKYLRIHNVNIHINVYQNPFINECELRRIFLNSHKDRRKDGVLFVRFRRTYVLNKQFNSTKYYSAFLECQYKIRLL